MDLWLPRHRFTMTALGAFVHEAVPYIAASVLHKELQHAPSSEQLTKSANRIRVESSPASMTADGRRKDKEDNLRT